jgi:hypothetical protein
MAEFVLQGDREMVSEERARELVKQVCTQTTMILLASWGQLPVS